MAFTDLGSLGATGSTGNNQASLALTTTAACAVGELVVIVVAVDNPQSGGDAGVASVTNSGTANTWTKAIQICNAVAAQGGASCSIWYTVATAAMASGATITATFTSTPFSDATAITARHFSLGVGQTAVIEGTPTTVLRNTAAAPGSLDLTTANIACLRIRGIAIEMGATTALTPTASWTAWAAGQSATTGTTGEMAARAEHRIVTGTTAASNPTLISSAINANVYAAFKEADAGISGTLTVTETGVDDATFDNGLVGLIGTLAATEATDVVAMSGIKSDVIGTLATQEGLTELTADSTLYTADNDVVRVNTAFSIGDDATFAGNVAEGPVAIPGTLNAVEAADTAGFAGTVTWLGTLAATEAADVCAFAGLVGRSGTLAVTEALDTAAFAGSVQWNAVLAVTEAVDTASFAGLVGRSGVLAATEAADTAAFVGLVGRSGVLAATEAADTAAFAGTTEFPSLVGTLAATETQDTAAFAGGSVIGAVLAATENADASVFAGLVGLSGTLAATEIQDTVAFAGGPVVAGALAVAEAGTDTADIHAVLTNSGTLNAVEGGADAAAFSGAVFMPATLAATEARDVCAISGYRSLVDEKVGILNAFESGYFGGDPVTADTTLVTADSTFFTADMDLKGGDVAHFAGGVVISGVLAASEDNPYAYLPTADATIVTADSTLYTADSDRYGADAANFNGDVLVSGTFAATEDADAASFDVTVATLGTLLAIETGADQARFIGGVSLPAFGVLAAQEASDTAHFAMPRWEEIEEGNGLRNEVQRTIWLTGQGGRVTWLENEVEDTSELENLNPEVVSLANEVLRITELRP